MVMGVRTMEKGPGDLGRKISCTGREERKVERDGVNCLHANMFSTPRVDKGVRATESFQFKSVIIFAGK